METIRSLLPGEVDDAARLNLVKVLGRQSERFPENTRALEEWLRREGSTTVRKGIATALVEARRRAAEQSSG
jgi:hypothetical protein